MPPGLRIRRTKHNTPTTPTTPPTRQAAVRPVSCRIPTRIGRAIGDSGRYQLSAVRALPLRARRGRRRGSDPTHQHNVVLQASDGRVAVCVLSQGSIDRPTFVPGQALPTRYADGRGRVDGDGKTWRSNDGHESPAIEDGATFPALADILPDLRPTFTTRDQTKPSDSGWPAVAVAISVNRLKQIASGLGTDSVTLMVPYPRPRSGKDRSNPSVTDPIAVCPANGDAVDGVAVMMPETVEQGFDYYRQLREAVARAEQPTKHTPSRKESA